MMPRLTSGILQLQFKPFLQALLCVYHFSSPFFGSGKRSVYQRSNFFALLLDDRLNTRNVLRRRNKFLEEGSYCVLCQDNVEETAWHLFFECTSSVTRWLHNGTCRVVSSDDCRAKGKFQLCFLHGLIPNCSMEHLERVEREKCIYLQQQGAVSYGLGNYFHR